jgi:hypothetical protein
MARPTKLNGISSDGKGGIILDQEEISLDQVKWEQFIESVGSEGGEVRIQLKRPQDTKFGLLETIPIADFSMDVIAKKYGAGDYKCSGHEVGSHKTIKWLQFSVSPLVKGTIDVGPAIGADPGATSREYADRNLNMIALMQQMQERADRAEEKRTAQQREDRAATRELFLTLGTALAPALIALFKPRETPAEAFNVLAEFAKAKASVPSQAVQIGEILQLVDRVKQSIDPEKEPEPKEEDSMISKLLTAAAPLIAGAMGPHPAQQPQMIPRPGSPQQPAPPLPSPQDAALQRNQQMLSMKIGFFIDMLIKAAQADQDPAIYAQQVLTLVSAQELDALRQVLSQPNWMPTLFGKHPAAMALPAWFNELRDYVLNPELMEQDQEEPTETVNPEIVPEPAAGVNGKNK